MLEIYSPALCAHEPGVPRRLDGHLWLCSFRRGAAAVRYRVTSPVSAATGVVDSSASRATDLESCSCRNSSGTGVESYSCEKSRGALPPNRATQRRLRAAKLSKTGVSARRFPARSRSELWNVQTCQVGSQSPLESALAQKLGWGVPPPGGFLR